MSAGLDLRLSHADAERLASLVEQARQNRWAERLWARDTSLWSGNAGVQRAISERLGWLDAPTHFRDETATLEAFGDAIRADGFSTAVVMGMGGSSLAPQVFHEVFGSAEGYLDFRALDSTDPAAVAAAVDDLDPLQTLWIVASKSGTTTEPLAFLADRWAAVAAALEERGSDQGPGEFFAAITDPDKSLEAIPHHDDLRERFLNPPDVGGRYSALTYVGLVPASLIGLDLDALLASAATMAARCSEPDPEANPGLLLGLAMGALARAGRDKLTLVTDPRIGAFGAWAEQLIAESTGKHGVGILPVDLEPHGDPAAYGGDRVFVELSLNAPGGDPGEASARRAHLNALQGLGHPVLRIEVDDPVDLAGECLRWEVATAFAGAVLGIDPFDQPNVEEAKERTRRLLSSSADGPGPADADARTTGSKTIDDRGNAEIRMRDVTEADLAAALAPVLRSRRPPEYIAIQAFIAPSPARDAAIARIRAALHVTRCATTAGYGPRFLHSTGQLHKGGAPTGWFIQLTSDHSPDRPIPGWPYTFGQLIDAQARGDREAIRAHDRPVIHIHLGPDVDADLATLESAVERALG